MAVFGGLTLLMVIPLAVRGDVIRLLFTLVQGAVSLAAGLSIARQYRPTAGQ